MVKSMETDEIKILNWNIQQGGGDRIERILETIIRHNSDIIVLTEFRDNKPGTLLRNQLKHCGYNFQSYPSALKKNMGSVLIAAKQSFSAKTFEEAVSGCAKGFILAQFSQFSILGCYLPGKDLKKKPWEFMLEFAERKSQDQLLMIGDFNTGQHYIDEGGATFRYSHQFLNLKKLGWIDAWRHTNQDKREYTWYSKQSDNKFRLDHVFASPPLMPYLGECHYSHEERLSGLSDHSIQLAYLKI